MNYELLSSLRGITGRFSMLYGDLHIQNFDYYTPEKLDFNHSHCCHEIYYCLSGQVDVVTAQTEYHLKAGEILYISPNTYHFCKFHPNDRYSYAILDFDLSDRNPSQSDTKRYAEFIADEESLISALADKSCLMGVDVCGCREELDNICRSLERSVCGNYTKIRNYLLNFFIAELQSLAAAPVRADFLESLNSGLHNKAVRIRSYMMEHCREQMTVQSISEALSYSPRHVQRIISDFYGVSFSKMLAECRLNRAKLLLCYTNDSLETISENSGINSSASLYKLFKKSTGMAPSEFRKICERDDREKL